MNTLPDKTEPADRLLERVVIGGDLSKLTPLERTRHYIRVCKSMGLNEWTQPFAYLTLQGKQTLYAKKDAADQLRRIRGVSIEILHQGLTDDLYSVHVQATDATGRKDEDLGIVPLPSHVKGEIRSNTMMKAVTKAKRRVTLSICGLGFLDEIEVESIRGAKTEEAPSAEELTLAQEMNDGIPEQFADAPPTQSTASATAAAGPEKDHPPLPKAAATIPTKNLAMALEAASHGRNHLNKYYQGRGSKEKKEILDHEDELKALFPEKDK
jgi:hypothetical protein